VEEAEALAREAVTLMEPSDAISIKADALEELARVLVAADERAEAVEVLERALSLREQKGNLTSAEAVRRKLAELQSS
jgi:hypothetical protein